ncbi:MAG: IclR family transcriptional regulator [Lachnospiraceae bacterium]|nr:IclR family transcriptional regulator [Lachnospiraceae bacterium]
MSVGSGNNEKYMLGSVSNALEVLDLLSEHEQLGPAEISKMLGISKATAFRLLSTLESRGYVIKNSDAKYMLGKKLAYLGEIVTSRQDNYALARPELLKLRDMINETIHMSVLLSNLNMMFIEKISPDRNLRMQSKIGFEQPAYSYASGKVLLSGLIGTSREKELESIKFKKLTNTTITSHSELMKELNAIRIYGYGVDDEESEVGLTCFAVPVYNADQRISCAISASGTTQRMRENKEKYISALKETALKITELLGGTMPESK